MSTKQNAQQAVSDYFKENEDADHTISATQLSELVDRDPKTVRAQLRKIAARNQSELKGARWRITKTLATNELERVMRLNEKAEATS